MGNRKIQIAHVVYSVSQTFGTHPSTVSLNLIKYEFWGGFENKSQVASNRRKENKSRYHTFIVQRG
jgi:hypothetical protein